MVSPAFRCAAALSFLLPLSLALGPSTVHGADEDLASLSIEDLMEIEVTSASKRAEPLAEASAAVYAASVV